MTKRRRSSPWRFGSTVLGALSSLYLLSAVTLFVVTDAQLVAEGILATGSAVTGALIVLLTRGWADPGRDDKEPPVDEGGPDPG